jgi:hypothetical protein
VIQVLIGDGAVRTIDENVAIEVFSALITRNGGSQEAKVTVGSL